MRPLFGILAVAVTLWAEGAAFCADAKQPAVNTIVLATREPDHSGSDGYPLPHLARELVRQAFLIAARDECGLLTRDTTLREVADVQAGDNPTFEVFSKVTYAKKGVDFNYVLSEGQGKTQKKIWKWKFHVENGVWDIAIKSPESMAVLPAKAEAFSRGELKKRLDRKGWGTPVPPARTSSVVPSQAAARIWEWNEFAVLSGLRQLHSEIHEKGESPELLAALVIGYANLGMLTEFFFSPAHKAFSARALLYAERLLQKTDGSSWALWHRAYVRAVLSLTELADKDLAAAKAAPGPTSTPSSKASSTSARPLPFWTDVIDGYCRGNMAEMLKKAGTPEQRRLARLLNFEAAMLVLDNNLRIKAGQAVAEDCPDCFRALDGMGSMKSLDVLGHVSEQGFGLLSETLRRRLPDMPGLPEALAKRIHGHKPSEHDADEVTYRNQLVAEIKDAGKPGRDKIEPSLAVVGQVIEEIEFEQLRGRLDFERNAIAVPTDETIAAYRPLCERHPYGAFVDLFSNSQLQIIKAAAILAQKIDPAELTLLQAEALRIGWYYRRDLASRWLEVMKSHADPVLRDELLGIAAGVIRTPPVEKYNAPYMKMIAGTSSKLPAAVAVQITRNWKECESRAADFERDFADDPTVFTALMTKYKELKKYSDAERCAKRRVEMSPDYASYWYLADIYRDMGSGARRKETLEKALGVAMHGLEQFRIQEMIARHHMERKQWSEALPYAMGAAESYSSWGLECAARCHEMLGDFKTAESLMRTRSQRYDNQIVGWLTWCHRTGRGDATAAAEMARQRFDALGTSPTFKDLEQIGIYCLLEKEPEKALAVFEKNYGITHNPYHAMHAAIAADSIGNAKARDANLGKIIEAGDRSRAKTVGELYMRMAVLMKYSSAPAMMKDFDFKQADLILADAAKVNPRVDTPLKYFLSMFLKSRGEAEKSRDYLVRCAGTAFYNDPTQAIACESLRAMKVSFVVLGDERPPTD